MIEAKELRIGNWILAGVMIEPIKVFCITFDRKDRHLINGQIPESHISGVPLSAEVLEACGFEKKMGWAAIGLADPKEDEFDKWDDLTLTKLTKGKYPNANGHYYYYLGGRPTTRVTYLHQLQNLFHALCGEELNYKSV